MSEHLQSRVELSILETISLLQIVELDETFLSNWKQDHEQNERVWVNLRMRTSSGLFFKNVWISRKKWRRTVDNIGSCEQNERLFTWGWFCSLWEPIHQEKPERALWWFNICSWRTAIMTLSYWEKQHPKYYVITSKAPKVRISKVRNVLSSKQLTCINAHC